ncbi:C25 family cysteine peptidase [uncultured Pontibacter sp.]|uniref:putative type IX secretion system sortase PorU2 n=1 Tax=uncultured Pontibacter sp. TaxID=453356 RepID=UPI002602C809|nr:C25 family cysteine peptidase [uncultured Pontibacter sp.]
MYTQQATQLVLSSNMRKHFILVFILGALSFALPAQAQKIYGNEWIKHDQTYYKIKVAQTGLYKLDYAYLDKLGMAGADPRNIQLYRRGKEVPLYVAGEADGNLGPQDYIEFFGERNDGALDNELYKNPVHQVHQLYSLYTDTAAYFLTVAPTAGKRVREINPESVGKTPEPYHIHKATAVFANNYENGKVYGAARMSWMDKAEGWSGSASRFERVPNAVAFRISDIANVETTGPKPEVSFSAYARNNIVHYFGIKTGTTSTPGRVLQRFEVDGFGTVTGKAALEFSEITMPGTFMLWTSPDVHETTDNQISISHWRLTYPRKNILSGASMFIYTDSSRSVNPYFEFANTPSSVVAYDLTDSENIVRVQGRVVGSSKGFVIETGSKSHKVLLANTANALVPAGVAQKVTFRPINPDLVNYILLSNKRLAGALAAPKQYAAYRASAAGGGYDTLLVYIDDIINQYHYGEFSPNAIRRFVSHMSASSVAKQMLILGKGIEYNRINHRNATQRLLDFVPTGGTPSSDAMFAMDYRNNNFKVTMPIGRVAATSATDIINYLNKIKEYEAVPDGLEWRKNILQLGGGKSVGEINQIANYLKSYAKIAEGPLLGAIVTEKYRQNVSEVVEVVNVSEEVNRGLSLITFFGHSSPGTTDLDIGYASTAVNNYKNKGKYPIMLMNGCNVGDSYVPNSVSFGEDWLNTPDKGGIALIAHVGAGYMNFLDLYSSYFYTVAFEEEAFYGATLGRVQQETVNRVAQTTSNDIATAMVAEMALQGDPALKVYNPSKPDYLFKDNSFSVTSPAGETVIATADEFVVTVNVNNLGKVITDSVTVTVTRTLANNSTVSYDPIKVGPIMRAGKVRLKLNNKGMSALGMNSFEVKLDGTNAVDELNEGNNTATFQHFFPISGLVALSPSNYGIVNTTKVTLAVQATQLNTNTKGFYFELDTTQAFNSPLKQSHTSAYTLMPSWDVNLPKGAADTDSTVYYWRARFATYAAGEDTAWAASSFRFIPNGGNGWSQSHYGQFKTATTSKLANEGKESVNWNFDRIKAEIAIKTVGGDFRFTNSPYGIYLDGIRVFEGSCSDPGGSATGRIFAIVINDKTLKKVEGLGASFCQSYPYIYEFGDMNVAANREKIIAFINAVPQGHYVVAMTVNKVPFESFTGAQKAAFGQIGSTLINDLKNSYPFGIIGQKGAAPGTAKEQTGVTDETTPITSQVVIMNDVLYSRQTEGTITSTIIGPALKWTSLHHNIEKYKNGDDTYQLSLIGINAKGEEKVLVEEVSQKIFDLSTINASEYPSLRLKAQLSDEQDRTAPQLREWFVYHDAAPEGVIRPDLVNISEAILTEQATKGSITVPMAFQNLTPTAFQDSVTVELTLTGEKSDPVVTRFKIKPIGPNETVNFQRTISTLQLEGEYKLNIFVNPRVLPEQQYFNNVYEVKFATRPKLHPIMDVAFDGVHILDGELVAPSPLISITVKDENRFVFLQDPSTMSVILLDPNGNELDVSLMNNPSEVRYFPADEKNDFRLEYKPEKLENGKYTLEVRARDMAGRASGVSPYRISFEVVNESKITNFYPFPNPFSTKTNFIFTLTGNQVPEHLKIQIMTVTGKVVKEIMKEEIGPIRIGNNKTEYAWDGTDAYGDKLANGVYLYRVVMSQVDDGMKHMYKTGDKSFKNGYGKIYILR